ncbi:MAG: urease accessory protein UreD, partial [Pseudomonadota bacterium]|nr:urease accessory protein UreD [Pseudomonadota bacterium]
MARLYQHDPIRILFPQPAAGDPATAAITNIAGGWVGGDRITFHARVEAGAEALIAQQAAEKIYRSTGATTTVDVHLRAAPRATLEWLPQETILFDTARLRRRTTLDVVGDGRVMAGEILVFGRRAMAETFTAGLAREVWEVRRDGRLVWLDAMHLADDVAAVLAAPA